jgi:hypothetical protein
MVLCPAAEKLTGHKASGNGPYGGFKMLDRHYTFFSDMGHGWLRVTIDDCKAIGLSKSDFSWYSYADKDWLYLEEDCDAAKFIAAYVRTVGEMPIIHDVHTNGNSVIRSKARVVQRRA